MFYRGEKNPTSEQSLIARIFWSYFIDQETEFPIFRDQIIQFLPNTIQDAFALIRSHHSTFQHGVNKAHILLIIDEFHKFRGSTSFHLTEEQKLNGINLLQQICLLMTDHANHIIISSLDEDLLRNAATMSGRSIIWIPLSGLNFTQSCLTLEEAPGAQYLHNQCARASGGHPRSLEACYYALVRYPEDFKDHTCLRKILKDASNNIIGGTRVTTTMIAAGILSDSMPLHTIINDHSGNALIADTIYIHNIVNTGLGLFVPIVPGLLILNYRYLSRDNSDFLTAMRQVLDMTIKDRSHMSTHLGDRFELFHFYFEVLKQIARKECKALDYNHRWSIQSKYVCSTIADHYGLFDSRIDLSENQWLAAIRMEPLQQQITLNSFLNSELRWPVNKYTTKYVMRNIDELDRYIKLNRLNFIKCHHNFKGIDAIIICRNKRTAQLTFLLLEMKYSGNSPSMLSKAIILEKLNLQKDVVAKLRIHNNKFQVISVFVLWRELESDLLNWFPWPNRNRSSAHYMLRKRRMPIPNNLPDGIIVLGKNQLKQFYSSLSPFADFESDVDSPNDLEELISPAVVYVKRSLLCF